jgi:hypothetical protein
MSTVEGMWSRRLNRDFALRFGYGRHAIRHHTLAGEFVEEQIEAGVDFNRALTISPRTRVAFTTRTSILRQPHRGARFRLNGDFLLARRFQRTWKLQFDANRSTDFLPGFVEPFLVDSIGLSMSGLFAARVEFVTVLRGSRGDYGYAGDLGRFARAGSTTQVNIAVTRHLGFYGQYGFYHHATPIGASSIAPLGDLSRQTFTAGISTWVPVFVRERIPIDSR